MSERHSYLVLSSPYGPIALTVEALRAARDLARSIVPDDTAPNETSRAQTPELLDANATARLLGIRASWLLKRARVREIPHVRVGKYVRFDPDEVRAALRDRHADSQYAGHSQPPDSKARNHGSAQFSARTNSAVSPKE